MQTRLAEFVRDTAEGKEADAILRKCVHCGFCTATCPTYQLLGDELDGPRGRIYLIKQVLEGAEPTARTQQHLDRCLTCRSCETTCPSGVRYGRLVDIGRGVVEARVQRPFGDRLKRAALRGIIPHPGRFGTLLALGRLVRPLLPKELAGKIMPASATGSWPAPRHARRMLVLDGCAQSSLAPGINAAAARVLDRAGISLVRIAGTGCCGAVAFHLNAQADALDSMRRNIDAWWPHVESGAEAIVSTATGCGVMIKDYGHLLAGDPAYAAKAERISTLCRDVSEVVIGEQAKLVPTALPRTCSRVAFHAPCTMQHGLRLRGGVESLLAAFGFDLTPVPDGHLCCGSAGTYSLLQPDLSQRLLANKLAALTSGAPDTIASANIGCLGHLASGANIPVRHWIELVDEALAPAPRT